MRRICICIILIGITIYYCSTSKAQTAQIDRYEVDKKLQFVFEQGSYPVDFLTDSNGHNWALIAKNGNKRTLWKNGVKMNDKLGGFLFSINTVSGSRVLVATERDNHAFITVDSATYGPFNTISANHVVFSADEVHFAFAAGYKPDPTQEDYRVIVDGIESPKYDSIDLDHYGLFDFTPDSRRLLYIARKHKKWFAVIDGHQGMDFDSIGGRPAFSSDGSKIAYIGYTKDSARLVINDSIIATYCDIDDLVFSPIENRLAYTARIQRDSTVSVFIDQKSLVGHYASRWPVFSKDGKHFGYWASQKDSGQYVVMDTLRTSFFKSTSDLRFSNDGRHWYTTQRLATKPRKLQYLMDGIPGIVIEGELEKINTFFAPAGNHIVYVWDVDSTEERIIIDSGQSLAYKRISNVAFSPDGRHFAYSAADKGIGKYCLYVDGSKTCDSLYEFTNPTFSPDGKDVACFCMAKNRKCAYINHTFGEAFTNAFPDQLSFDQQGRITFYGVRNDSLYKVTLSPVQ